MYAIAQKEQLGFDKAVEECGAPMPATTSIAPLLTFACPCAPEYRMSRYGVTPNGVPCDTLSDACACVPAQMMIMPPQMLL